MKMKFQIRTGVWQCEPKDQRNHLLRRWIVRIIILKPSRLSEYYHYCSWLNYKDNKEKWFHLKLLQKIQWWNNFKLVKGHLLTPQPLDFTTQQPLNPKLIYVSTINGVESILPTPKVTERTILLVLWVYLQFLQREMMIVEEEKKI